MRPTLLIPRGPHVATRIHGFTMIEMVTTLLLVGILAAVAVPRMDGTRTLAAAGWRDQVLGALFQARTLAQGHRRLVCVNLATNEVRLSIAAANPASSCGLSLAGHDGDARWAFDGQGLALSVSPSGPLYFQPDGRITSDGAGNAPVNASVAISGLDNITLTGETGHAY